MAEKSGGARGKYLYAIVDNGNHRTYEESGVNGGAVYDISEGGIAAVVSDLSDRRIRPERRHLAAHQTVLRSLMASATPLPMSFGVIAGNRQEVMRILRLNRAAFLQQLQRLRGKTEMGLRVTWDVPNIFEYFVRTHAELRSLRDRLFSTNREPTQEEKIEVGRLFDRLLNEDRETCAEMVEAALEPHCAALKRNPPKNESEVMNLACLVGQSKQTAFEEAVFEAARQFDHNFAFDYNGPWAPHHFVELDLKL